MEKLKKEIDPTMIDEALGMLYEPMKLIDNKAYSTKDAVIRFIEKNKSDGWISDHNDEAIKKIAKAYGRGIVEGASKTKTPSEINRLFKDYNPVIEDYHLIMMSMMIYDCFSGEHDPKLFEVDFDLWNKLINTDIKNVTKSYIKMPFDTMVINFDTIYDVITKVKTNKQNTESEEEAWFNSMLVDSDSELYQKIKFVYYTLS